MGFINKNLLSSVANGVVNNAVNGAVNGYSGGIVSYQNGKFYPTPGHPVATVANAAIDIANGGDPAAAVKAAAITSTRSYLQTQGIPPDLIDAGLESVQTGNLSSVEAAAMEDIIGPGGLSSIGLDAFGGPGSQVSSIPYDANEFMGLGGGVVQYPGDLETSHPTWMEIWSYKRTGIAVGNNHSENSFTLSPVQGISNICLPIPTGVGTAYGHSWDEGDVSMMNELVAGTAGQIMQDAADGISTSGVVESIKQRVSEGLGDSTLPATALIAAGDVLGSAAVQGATGRAAFNNVLVNYSGPQFRTFEYSFSFKPTHQGEQRAVQNIIKFLKIGQAPDLLNPGQLGRLYEIPLFFKIKYMSPSGELAQMNKIGFCALTGLSVKYGGDRFQTFATDNSPVQTDISMSFKEVQLLDRKAIMQGY
jgi:hypothetical protein